MRNEIFSDVELLENVIRDQFEKGDYIILQLRNEIGGNPNSVMKATKYYWLLHGFILGRNVVRI